MDTGSKVMETGDAEFIGQFPGGAALEDITPSEAFARGLVRIPPRLHDGSGGLPRVCYLNFVKRVLDLLLGSALLLIFSPLIGLGWLAVRLTSPGAGFFSQGRVGLGGRRISMCKLRSMYIDQDSRVDMEQVRRDEARGILFKIENDPRVTPVGRFIRKTSIDELPQLWNVVRGEMSLVGPRPLVPHMLDPYPEIKEARCRVRPGITGLWQVNARHLNRSAMGMVNYDLEYVERCSLLVDLGILLRTLPVTIKAKGAH